MVSTVTPKKILILGAGFAGIRVAQDLCKKIKNTSHSITLIDENLSHVFRGDLYEVATAFNEKITQECLVRLKETVATPIKKLVDRKKVRFVHSRVTGIDPKNRKVQLSKGADLEYDYLVVTLGSITNYFNIPGLQQFSFPLKSVQDALAINCHLDQFFQDLWKNKSQKTIHITVAGGGATGVETTGELIGSIKKLCKKYGGISNKIIIRLIEGGGTLAGMNEKYTRSICERFQKLGIEIHLNSYLAEATGDMILLQNKKLPNDILIWTGGVQVSPVVQQSLGKKENRGAIPVNQYLQSDEYPEIFAAGDNAWFSDPKDKNQRIPMLAQAAYQQGGNIAKNLARILNGQQMIPFRPRRFMFVITLGGKYAIWKTGRFIFIGSWCWIIRRLVSFKYALSILPFGKAFKKWHHGSKIFVAND